MRLGLFGGSFDPVHFGHLLLAEAAREACALDEIWFVPAPAPPHKPEQTLLPIKQRIEMLELATAGLPEFGVHDLESGRDGPSYTVDTLTRVREDRPDDELFFLMGADSLTDLPTWRQPERIAELAKIVAVNRGFGECVIPDSLSSRLRDRVQLVDMPACGIASSDLRQRVSETRSIRFQTPRPVERLIRERGWYVMDRAE